MTHYMAELENSKHNYMSENPIEISFPSIDVESRQIGALSTVENHSKDYNHAMQCITGLAKTMSAIASSIEPLVVGWKKKEFNIDLDEVRKL